MKKNTAKITDLYTVDGACLQVFSKVIASMSHEIKNVLAIINESGGLIEDIILMSESGQGIYSDQVHSATSTIRSHTQRANYIMKNCNRFAHLNDKIVAEEPLAEILTLMVDLVKRQADMKNMTIERLYRDDIRITAPMLPLASLIYLLLRSMIDIGKKESEIRLYAEVSGNKIKILFENELSVKELVSIVDRSDIETLVKRLGGKVNSGDGIVETILAHDIA